MKYCLLSTDSQCEVVTFVSFTSSTVVVIAGPSEAQFSVHEVPLNFLNTVHLVKDQLEPDSAI